MDPRWRAAVVAGFVCVVAPVAASAQTATPPADAQGKIISMHGQVQHAPPQRENWDPARMFQPLFTSERVRTMTASRAAILFIDESQVKLNAGAVLTVQEIKRAGGASTTLQLEHGEAWFRTKNPNSGLTIRTPAAAAAIRGTEINLVVSPANQTTLTVVEGSVEFSNPQGSIVVNAGEEGTAVPGQAPTKRTILNPEDAVQWALYYPTDIAASERPAGTLTGTAAVADQHAQRASELLEAGQVVEARTEIDAALAAAPDAVRPLVLLSTVELRRNRPDEAMRAAERALAIRKDSIGALLAASEAAQARFDLDAAEAYLDRALAVDAANVHALVNRGRLRFGTDRVSEARRDLALAVRTAPDDAQVRSLRGFIELADGNVAGAVTDFTAATQADSELGEPHLGLGLAYFKQGRTNEGLLEMLTATLLEPKVSLYQSYLGKAYYQTNRFTEGLSALTTARRLDPRDPTPWLYTSLFLRDQNHQVDALDALRQAISLNDYRAVYRSRLLLDRDLATKNVSLAEIYNQLGFLSWGAFEAQNSLETDFTNSAAHLFLADSYGQLSDRTQASGSELLQYFLYAPVNRNSFNSFSEYTALLDQPRRQLDVELQTGTRNRNFVSGTTRSGNDRFAHVAFLQTWRQESRRAGSLVSNVRDDHFQGFFQGKAALADRSDLFFTFQGVRNDTGVDLDTTSVYGLDTSTPIILRQFTTTPDRTITNRFTDVQATLGFRHQWNAGSALIGTATYDNLEQTVENPSSSFACSGLDITQFGVRSNSRTRNPFESFDWQVQQTTRLGRRHQLIVGEQVFSLNKARNCNEDIFDPVTGAVAFPLSTSVSGDDSAQVTYARDEIQLTRGVHLSLGVSYQNVDYSDLSTRKPFESSQWNPLLGVSVRVAPRTFLRAAAFRNLNTNFLSSRISPPTISGFLIERNEFPTAKRREFDVSLEHAASRAFAGVRLFQQDSTVPFLLATGGFIPEADARRIGTVGYVNWIVTPRLSLFADDYLVHLGTNAFDRLDNLARVGANVVSPIGLFVRVTGSYLSQRFNDTVITGLPRSGFGLADLQIGYEFAGKRGLLSFNGSNLFERRFQAVVEGLSVNPIVPERRAIASLRWRVF